VQGTGSALDLGLRTAIVREWKAEDIGVHYYGCSGVGAIADHVGVEAMDGLFFAEGLTGVDTALLWFMNAVQNNCYAEGSLP
jgi:hypothetical protein